MTKPLNNGPLFLNIPERVKKAVLANDVSALEAIERAVQRRVEDARGIGWPALAASWEAEYQRIKMVVQTVKGQV